MKRLWIVVVALFVPLSVYAVDDNARFNEIELMTSANQTIDNDRLFVVLSAQYDNQKSENVSQRINTDMLWAVEQSKSFKEIDVSTGNYRIYPSYKDNKLISWRGKQDLTIQTDKFDEASKLLSILQTRLIMENMYFSVSDEIKEKTENELIESALDKFKQRALIVKNKLDAKGYKIILLRINFSGGGPQPRFMAMNAEMAPPALESGTTKIEVNISGSIELQK